MEPFPRIRIVAAVVVATAMLCTLNTAIGDERDTSQWRLAFEDSFDRSEPGEQWDFVLGQGKIVDGRMHVAATRDCVVAMVNRDFADDVRLEFDAETDPKMPPCDIACGLGGSNFISYGYLLQFGARGNQANQLHTSIARGMPFQLDEKPPFVIEYGKTYKCVAEKEGRRVSYTVDGTKLLEVTDPDVLGGPGFGRVCLITWSGMYVDNVNVYERVSPAPDGPILIRKPESLDVGFRWENRTLVYRGSKSLPEQVRSGIEAYNARQYARSFELLTSVKPPTRESVVASAYVLGDLAFFEKEADQQTVAELARTAASAHPEDRSAVDFALLAKWFSGVTIPSRNKRDAERVYQVGAANNPFYYKAMLYRARYHLARARESGLQRQSQEALELLLALKKLWPDHPGIADLTGEQTAWGPELTRAETEGPLWARLLQEGLARSHAILNWWFTHRQAADGQLGGGWGDDVELLRSWGMPASITSARQIPVEGIRKLADGVWEHVLHGNGYPEDGDVEHAAEPAADSQPLMMLLRYGEPEYVERNLKTAKFLRDVAMGVNERGFLQFKSCYFGTDGVNLHPSAVGQNIYHSRAMRHFVWLAWYGLPEAREVLLAWADGLREIAMAEIGPKPAGYMPFTMFWPSGNIYPPENRFWLDERAHAYGVSPGKLWKYHFPLCSAYYFSRGRQFLEPIDRMMDLASMSAGTAPYDESLPRDHIKNLLSDLSRETSVDVSTMCRWLTGSSMHDGFGLSASMCLQVDRDINRFVRTLEPAISNLRINWAAKTSEVLQTDRFDLPGDVAIFSAYTGAVTALIEDGLIPTIAVTWDTPDLNFAALVLHASPDRMRVLLHNFNNDAMPVGLKPWQLVPGEYLLNRGVQQGNGPRPIAWEPPVMVTHVCRGTPIHLDIPPGSTSVIELRLQKELSRPALLPDLALDRKDVAITGNDVHVTVHNIGSAQANEFSLILETESDAGWTAVSQTRVSGIPAVKDLEPATTHAVLTGAAPKPGVRFRVAVDPENLVDELYELNNQVALSAQGAPSTGEQSMHAAPTTLYVTENDGFVTCVNRLHPGNRFGYRFHEHMPLIHGPIPKDLQAAGIDPVEATRLVQDFARRPKMLKYKVHVDKKEWVPQEWTFYVAPVEDGVELLLVVETKDQGLNEYYGIQQCFRLSGSTNELWRRPIADAPAFSEYDLWNVDEKDKPDKTSLTYVVRKGVWATLPAMLGAVGARTPLGVQVDGLLTGGKLETMPLIGPYKARAEAPIDCGLITRRNREGNWVCGIFWDRTSHVTNHHPADCLHSIVNIGGMPPHAKRAVRGKIYWFQGDLQDLLDHWRRDWKHSSEGARK